MEQFFELIALLVAGAVQYARSKGEQVTVQDIVSRAEKHLQDNTAALDEIAKRHLARFSGEP